MEVFDGVYPDSVCKTELGYIWVKMSLFNSECVYNRCVCRLCGVDVYVWCVKRIWCVCIVCMECGKSWIKVIERIGSLECIYGWLSVARM